MAYSDVATVGFALRNIDKTSSGDFGRLPVAVGQTYNALKAALNMDNSISKTAKNIFNAGIEVAKSDKVFNGVSKTVKFASEHVNPLIVCSSGVKVLLADDKKSAIISEGGCLAGMFLTEGLMKKHLNKVLDKLPVSAKWKPIIKGIIFIAGSIGGSTLGQKLGDNIAEALKSPEQLLKEEIAARAKAKPINVKS
ncbi:hypothetical protein HDR58_06795 [bacterium]|nr:hypothetical protein [bacterium]